MNFDLMSLIKMLSNNNIKDFHPPNQTNSAASQQNVPGGQNNASTASKNAKNGQVDQKNVQKSQEEQKKQPAYTANYNYAAFVARHDRLSKEIDRRIQDDETSKP